MNRIVYFITGFVLIGVLLALLWAARTHRSTVEALPQVLAREFRVFLDKELITDINLEAVERRAEEVRTQYPYIEEVVIVYMADAEPHVIYPFFYRFDHRSPPHENRSLRFHRIADENDNPLGGFYVKISAQRDYLFFAAIMGSILALVVVAGLGYYTIRTKDEEVRKTSSLLDEKQRQLIHLERLALVGQVTANLLHDLKKPILNIRAESESLDDPEFKKIVNEEADLFMGMLRDLHLESLLKRDHERAEFVDVAEILIRSLRLVKYAQEKVQVEPYFPDTLPFVFAQRHQLAQVFSNIVLNAFQALDGEGIIRITADDLVDDDGSRWLEVIITDDGPGMPYEVLNNIFEPFYSGSNIGESTGLGLYISKSIVESMGGEIEAHSIPKHGTTFAIRFPISEEEEIA